MEWIISQGLTVYPHALEVMAARVAAIQQGEADELVWMVEHPPLYTLGTSANASDVLIPPLTSPTLGGGEERGNGLPIPIYETGRGGQVTYHGPGQRVVYLMRDLKKHAGEKGPDLRAYVKQLEQWIILTLQHVGIEGFTREGRVGVWVDQSPVASRQSLVQASLGRKESAVVPLPLRERLGEGALNQSASPSTPLTQPSPARAEGFKPASMSATTHHSPPTTHEAKIAALGVRVQKWVTSHGIAINVNPDLSHYAGIVPCGIREFGVTSIQALGVDVGMDAVDTALREKFVQVFV